MEALALFLLYLIGVAISILFTYLLMRIKWQLGFVPLMFYMVAMVYFWVQPFIDDYGLGFTGFYIFAVFFTMATIGNGVFIWHTKKLEREAEIMRRRREANPDKRGVERWDEDTPTLKQPKNGQ
ncbi:MAG: hypothetical protein ACLFUQ_02670 [Candidatus Izemoplasmataceae bacterium]